VSGLLFRAVVASQTPQSRLPVSDLRHPFRACEVTVERAPRPIGLPLGVDMQGDPRDLAPVGAVRVGIEHAEIRDQMLLVVHREREIGGREIGGCQSDCNTIVSGSLACEGNLSVIAVSPAAGSPADGAAAFAGAPAGGGTLVYGFGHFGRR